MSPTAHRAGERLSSAPPSLTCSVKEPVPLQFVAGSARHTVLAGQLFDGPGQLESDRPEQIGRQLASVALGKRCAPPHAVLPRVLSPARSRARLWPPVGIEPTTFSLRGGMTVCRSAPTG